ncbi:MAG: hypothetical protein KAJ49_09080 [Arcobacteraceae bacterium]|nr:hypothetical protein [Arcobacteraceae bacterium]
MTIPRVLFFLVILIVSLNSKEVSVFGAGDVDSSSPYGLTNAEKVIYKNTKKISNIKNKINKINNNINNIESSYEDLIQKLEGMESVYESDSKSLYRTKKVLSLINNSIEANSVNIEVTSINLAKNSILLKQVIINSKKLLELENKIDNFISLQEKNNKIVEKTLKNTTKLINDINSKYITKKQFDELITFVNKKNKPIKSSSKKHKKVVKRTNKELLKHAISLFKNNYLTKSKPMFIKLVNAKYKPAQSNYYLGEIFFYKKRYKDAIHHYKTSMMLYDQASYIPRLLLHSAISFEKTNDKENAINFYSTLVDAYPETKEAVEANKKLIN